MLWNSAALKVMNIQLDAMMIFGALLLCLSCADAFVVSMPGVALRLVNVGVLRSTVALSVTRLHAEVIVSPFDEAKSGSAAALVDDEELELS